MKTFSLVLGLLLALAVACGGDDDDSSGASPSGSEGGATSTQPSGSDGAPSPTEAPSGSGGSASSGEGAGTVTIGDEMIELNSARCFLEEQDVAGSPGKILFVGQGFGTLASGEEIVVDVSRYDEESLFYGDDIHIDVGDPFSDDFYSWRASADFGTIQLDGSTLRAEGLAFMHSEDFTETSGAFELHC